MSFIEGDLTLKPPGASSKTKRWCKVDTSEFSWYEKEGSSKALGKFSLAKGGAVVQMPSKEGGFLFNIYSDGKVLECSALTEAESDGWLEFIVNETKIEKKDEPPANNGKLKVSDFAIIKKLTGDAIAAEEFEKCVKYREYKNILDEIKAAVANEDFEKCVELRSKKKDLEKSMPEIDELRQKGLPDASSTANKTDTPVVAKPSDALDAIKSKLWANKGATPSAGVSALLLDDLKPRNTRGRETTGLVSPSEDRPVLTFKAWKADEGVSTDSDSESLVKGGVRFDLPNKKPKKRAKKQDYAMRTTWSGGGNMLQQAEMRRKEDEARRAAKKAAKAEKAKKAAAEAAAAQRAKKALSDREREAKWAKFAPKADTGPKKGMRTSWDSGFTVKAAEEHADSSSDNQGDESTTRDDRQTLDGSESQSLVKKVKKKPKKSKKDKKKSKKDKKKKKKKNVMRSTWGGGGALISFAPKRGEGGGGSKKRRDKNAGPQFRSDWQSGTDSFRLGDVVDKRNPNDPPPVKSALKQKKQSNGLSGLSRAADASDSREAQKIVAEHAKNSTRSGGTSSSTSSPAAKEKVATKKKSGFFSFMKKSDSKKTKK